MVPDVRISRMIAKQHTRTLDYGYHIIYLFDLECSEDDLGLNCQPWMSHPHYISIFQIYHIDYSNPVTKLKYSDALPPINQRGQSHLDSYTDFTSTWLCPKIFHHWIKNLGNPVSKHSELLVSHQGDLKFEGYLYPYLLKLLLIVECSRIDHVQ